MAQGASAGVLLDMRVTEFYCEIRKHLIPRQDFDVKIPCRSHLSVRPICLAALRKEERCVTAAARQIEFRTVITRPQSYTLALIFKSRKVEVHRSLHNDNEVDRLLLL